MEGDAVAFFDRGGFGAFGGEVFGFLPRIGFDRGLEGAAAGRVGEEGLDRDLGFLEATEFADAGQGLADRRGADHTALGIVFVGGGEGPGGEGDVVGFAQFGDIGSGGAEGGALGPGDSKGEPVPGRSRRRC